MKTLDVNGKVTLAEAVHGLKDEPLVLMEGRIPLAVLLPVEGADMETIALSLSPTFIRIIEESRREYEREGGISSEEMRRRFGLTDKQAKTETPPARKRKAN